MSEACGRGPTGVGAPYGARAWSASFLLAAFALACGNSDQQVTYIGITDATPPRLGRTENSVSPHDAESAADQASDGGTSVDQDAGGAPDRASGGDGVAPADADGAAPSDADNGAG